MELDVISDHFRTFSKECTGSSRLYEYLSEKIAEDKDLLRLSSYAKEGQPVPNLLFGAVHYLLLLGKSDPLGLYYGSITANPGVAEESFPAFKQFCMQYKDEIIPIMASKYVQTNEVRRCAYLYPVFCSIYTKLQRTLSLIEIGTSAGLQLQWDRYGYSYSSQPGVIYGNPNAELVLSSDIVGDDRPHLLLHTPPVSDRIGMDLHVNNLSDAEDCLWLRALIWPEHAERRESFDKAAEIAQEGCVQLVEGNGVELLAEWAARVEPDSVLCIYHTHVANQFSMNDKSKLLQTIRQIGQQRDVCHIYNNIWDRHLHLDTYIDGVSQETMIADIDGHGRWFRWLKPSND